MLSSAAERLVHTEEVEGSTPSVPTTGRIAVSDPVESFYTRARARKPVCYGCMRRAVRKHGKLCWWCKLTFGGHRHVRRTVRGGYKRTRRRR